jgi:hypothetical protein
MGLGAHTLFATTVSTAAAMVRQRFVKLAGTAEAGEQADTEGEAVLGVGRFDISTDEAAKGKFQTVDILGAVWVEAGAAVSIGDGVMTDADGKAIELTGGNTRVGTAWKEATADGDLIVVLLAG